LFPGEIRETNGQPGSNCFFSFAEFVSGGSWTCMHSGYIFCMHASFSIRGLAELVIDVLSEPIIVFQSVCNMLMPSLRCCRQMASLAPMCFFCLWQIFLLRIRTHLLHLLLRGSWYCYVFFVLESSQVTCRFEHQLFTQSRSASAGLEFGIGWELLNPI
jgi:hypothetical protein